MRSRYFFGLVALLFSCLTARAGDESETVADEPKEVVAPALLKPVTTEPDPPGLWASVEYLNWWIRSGPLSFPLVAVGNPADPIPGALGQRGTRVLTGREIDFGSRTGARLTLGAWLDSERTIAAELSGFFLMNQSGDGLAITTASAAGRGIYVPAVRVDLGRQGALSISDPVAGFAGYVATTSSSQLFGFEGNVIDNIARNECISIDVLAGLKYVDLIERLNQYGVSDDLVLLNTFTHIDRFRTRNQFYGAQVGAQATIREGAFFATLRGTVAAGVNSQSVDVSGISRLSGTLRGTFPGGFFTQPSNIGHQSKCDFSVIPQMALKVGVNCLDCLTVFAGYDCMYWYRTVRPGAQIDGRIDTPLSLGGATAVRVRPVPLFERSDFWAHGFSVGLDLRY